MWMVWPVSEFNESASSSPSGTCGMGQSAANEIGPSSSAARAKRSRLAGQNCALSTPPQTALLPCRRRFAHSTKRNSVHRTGGKEVFLFCALCAFYTRNCARWHALPISSSYWAFIIDLVDKALLNVLKRLGTWLKLWNSLLLTVCISLKLDLLSFSPMFLLLLMNLWMHVRSSMISS